jgi:hypothetical protein
MAKHSVQQLNREANTSKASWKEHADYISAFSTELSLNISGKQL